jgi:hypothetical protein
LRRIGSGFANAGRWAISSNDTYRRADVRGLDRNVFEGARGQAVKYGSAAAGAAGGSFLGRIGTRFVVTRNWVANKLSPKAQRVAVNTGTVAGGVAGAIGVPKIVGRVLLAIARRRPA